MPLPDKNLLYMIHHVFLPPKLPTTGDDPQAGNKDLSLLQTVKEALQGFQSHSGPGNIETIQAAGSMLEQLIRISDHHGWVQEAELVEAFKMLSSKGGVLPIFIRAQNAGLILRNENDSLLVASFELSPPNRVVTEAEGRLQRYFPGPAVAVNTGTFHDSGFQSTMAQTIAKMSQQTAFETKPKATKAGQEHVEHRDTTDPKLVTSFLMSVLEAVGQPADVDRIWKCTREEVLWSTGLLPWRRSPMWLFVRVTMQTTFARAGSVNIYKEFMVFFMARILDLARVGNMPSDVLHCMVCKISRRLLKLEERLERSWLPAVEDIVEKTRRLLETRWKLIIEKFEPGINMSALASLTFPADIVVQLPELEAFIAWIHCPPENTTRTPFSPSSLSPRLPSDTLPTEEPFQHNNPYFYLVAFEMWVASELDRWLAQHLSRPNTCAQISGLLYSYHRVASQHYEGNPENISLMILTILELWVACDKSATRLYGMLSDYDTAIAPGLLQSLLLPLKSQMERLSSLELYLRDRQRRAKGSSPSIFSGFGCPNSFSTRFYALSQAHRNLRAEIEKSAKAKREQKKAELSQKKRQYSDFMRDYESSSCQYYTDKKLIHSATCRKCKVLHKARSMSIEVHEWPLPRNELDVQSAIFELKCPPTFSHWRDATMYVIVDVLRSEYSREEKSETMYGLEYHLSQFIEQEPQRLRLRSKTKPHTITHRHAIAVSDATETSVCVNDGLTYFYYDNQSGYFVTTTEVTEKIPKACMYQVLDSPSLQDFLYRPHFRPNGPSPNAAIAQQSSCPNHMSLDEFKALAVLPLGTRTQWSNILVQLSVPSIDFKRVETFLTISQAIYQAGPPMHKCIAREGHQDLSNDSFCLRLDQSLRDGLARIKENWESFLALGAFVALSARLLSLTASGEVVKCCLDYLGVCRTTALSWARLVREKAQETPDDKQRAELLLRVFEICQVCASTFDVDDCHIQVILHEPASAAAFLECSIMIQETSHTALYSKHPVQRLHSDRYMRLTSRAFVILLSEITEKASTGLDVAIQRTWSGFRPSHVWKSHSASAEHWVLTKTASDPSSDFQEVHYNLLTGELLVDGLPLSRLPASFEEHPRYADFFGEATVEVIPTSMPGMQFEAMKPYQNGTVYLGLHKPSGASSSDLMIAHVRDQEIYDLLPPRLFQQKFPDHFIHDYAHWRCRTSGTIELRPIEKPWQPSPDHWEIRKSGTEWTMRKGDDMALMPLTSRTCHEVSRIFRSVESSTYLHIVLRVTERRVDIKLPRLKLGFFLFERASVLQSREFRGMYIDRSTDIETLLGLTSKIVLKDDQGGRLLLIPNGTVKWQRENNHIRVWVEEGTSTKVHPFHIDTRLGRLLDNGSLQCKLDLCYLHAVTAYCLPDNLTQKTGTEQALEILASAAVRSFDQLSRENVHTLHKIAELAPRREYYPPQQRLMQKVTWVADLSFLSQHALFLTEVESILSLVASLQFFHPKEQEKLTTLTQGERHLHRRDLIRSSTFRRSEFGAERHTADNDKIYESRNRDAVEDNRRVNSAMITSSRIFTGSSSVQCALPSGLADDLWELLNVGTRMHGAECTMEDLEIGYDAERLEDWRTFLATHWCQIHQFLHAPPTRVDKFRVMMFLATLAFSQDMDACTIQILVAIYTTSTMGQVSPPAAESFSLQCGHLFQKEALEKIIGLHLESFSRCPEYNLPQRPFEDYEEAEERRWATFNSNQKIVSSDFIHELEMQWPCEIPQMPTRNAFNIYLNTPKAMEAIGPQFKMWWNNLQLYSYLCRLNEVIRLQPVRAIANSKMRILAPSPLGPRRQGYIRTSELFSETPPLFLPISPDLSQILLRSDSRDSTISPDLVEMLDDLEKMASRKHERSYVEALQNSLAGLQGRNTSPSLIQGENIRTLLEENMKWSIEYVRQVYGFLLRALKQYCIITSYNSPKASPTLLLRQLSRRRWHCLSSAWQKLIVTYALALTTVQRAGRLLTADGNTADLIRELSNPGHKNWNPHDYPESLLFEVESGILIREVQEEIARQMRDPPGNANAVMQLNMGEGKSSVIVPIVAAALANGSRLVRVVVGKPQARQMLELLVSKLGGLSDRQIFHMPFSRALKLGPTEVQTINRTVRVCMETGGLLLVQPEHILSFKLMGIESLLSGEAEVSQSILDIQHYFDTCSRDIVDESDENFSVKFELIYTIGTQGPIEMSPERWILAQSVLRILAATVLEVKRESPLSIEVARGPAGSFPRTHFVREEAHELVRIRTAEAICSSGLPGLPVGHRSKAVRDAVYKYITTPDLSAAEASAIESCETFWTQSVKQRLLLLRGLLCKGVLAFAFGQKRWRVNYGLDRYRHPPTKLAVPFRAKDSPTPRSEFSQPDVVIILTCLSHYYGGLEDEDILLAFEHLVKSDQADIEYAEWMRDAPDLPEAFRRLSGINLKDRFQCHEKVFPHLRQAKAVADYFLSHIVFPKEMKGFPHKISTSGWDLGQTKVYPTTGFSGTSDAQHLLPLGVQHLDLKEQRHTNALVFQYLLQPENTVQSMPSLSESYCSSGEYLLQFLVDMPKPVQVILDAGAQILELEGVEVARAWLRMVSRDGDKQAVVFFDTNDALSVIDRNGYIESFQTSPFARQLDRCLVFLDEAHTRGTDLRLPGDYRAAVTLGANLTKDRLVQACMRMRKLGKGQSVVFVAPTDVQTKITAITGKAGDCIRVSDVLLWAIHETYADLRKSMPLWAAQGARFERQKDLWDTSRSATSIDMTIEQATAFLEDEVVGLDTRYGPSGDRGVAGILGKAKANSSLRRILERCEQFDIVHFASASLHEEQQRELSPETEQERQVERPCPAEPATHQLHKDVRAFVHSGKLDPKSSAFVCAFASLAATSAAAHFDVNQFPSDVLVTADFARTVKTPGKSSWTDAYQRSVQWILTSITGDGTVRHMVIISPFEAQELIPAIKKSSLVFLHLYAARPTLAFHPLDDLALYATPSLPSYWNLPRHLPLQLNLFSGQLYFCSFEEYKNACDFLGLAYQPAGDDIYVDSEGFIIPGLGKSSARFTRSPTNFLKILFAKIRRNCQGIEKTHWGKVLGGELLTSADFS